MLAQKLPDQGGNYLTVFLKGKMPRIQQVKVDCLEIPQIGISTVIREDVIIFPPDYQGRWLPGSEILLPFRVKADIRAIVME